MRKDIFDDNAKSLRWVVLIIFLLIFFAGLGARLFDLQIIGGKYYRNLAEGNRIRRIPIKAPRGEILDHNEKPLARNVPIYKIATFSSGGVVTETKTILREEALKIQTSSSDDVSRLLVDVGRVYPLGESAAHLIGYVNETQEQEIGAQVKCVENLASQEDVLRGWQPQVFLQLGDLIGRMGIEQQYDCILRGVNGEELIEVDARGRLVRRLGRREPVPGTTIKLSIDAALQKASYEALQQAPDEKGLPQASGSVVRGAVVVQIPQTGEVLSLVSSPSFDPNTLSENYVKLSEDKNLPFFNRVISGAFHPGSTFKIVTSVASLEEQVLDENFKYTDVGFIEAGGLKFRNWYFVRYGKGEGEMNIVRAITRSTDTFFYIAGEKVGIDSIARWAGKLGIGKKSGIDLPNEALGLMPTPEWKLKTKGERWFLGNTYNTAIGQGDVTTTPLQISQMISVIASGGKLCIPHVLKPEPGTWNLETCKEIGISQETISLIKQGMLGACSPGGTSLRFVDFKHKVACKTGTAETAGEKTHAWFTAFSSPTEASAEGDRPQIVATALIEEGGEGSTVAAPVVKKIFEEYFK